MDTLDIAEDFYSIQCEGISTGIPSYFIRLANCNLTCGASAKTVNRLRKREKYVELVPEGKASWVCDTIPVWLKGDKKPFSYVTNKWDELFIAPNIWRGETHVVWTGGEPCLPKNQEGIIAFLKWLKYPYVYSEIETNGTILFGKELFDRINQINCSPKLSNSGMSEKKRINVEVITQIKMHPNYQFKFVINTEEDIKEMFETYIYSFTIPLSKVVCMPGMDKQSQYFELTKWVLEMAKKYGFRGMSRLHIAAWDQVTGV